MTTCPVCGKAAEFGRYCRFCGAPLPQQALEPPPALRATSPDPGESPAPALRATSPDPGESRPTKPRRFWRWVARGTLWLIFVVMTLIVGLIVAASIWDPIALPLSIIAAVVPAIVYSRLVLRLDRYEREPRRVVIGAFAWGAVGAIFFSLIIELISGGILIATVGEDAGTILTIGVGAPVIEETCKGLALLALLFFYRDELDNVLDGLVYGALIGLGFAMTENMLYFGAAYIEDGFGAFGVLFIVRAVIDGFGHALYTGTVGAAVGWSRSRYRKGKMRIIVPIIGWALAVFQHFLWNTGLIVLASMEGEDVSVLKVALIEAPLFIVPAIVVLFLIARVSSRRELEILRTQLAPEVANGVLTPDEYATLTDNSRRRAALNEAARGGQPVLEQQQRFFQVAAELAFRKYHLSRGERPKPGQRAPEDAYREELGVLRRKLERV